MELAGTLLCQGIQLPSYFFQENRVSLSISRIGKGQPQFATIGVLSSPDLWEIEILLSQKMPNASSLRELAGLLGELLQKNAGPCRQLMTLLPHSAFLSGPIVEAGFRDICQFVDYHWAGKTDFPLLPLTEEIEFLPLAEFSTHSLEKLFCSTCVNTLDCPEGSSYRKNADIFSSLISAQHLSADFSFCLLKRGELVGLLIGIYAFGCPEIQYLGVVPGARGKKLGRLLAEEFLRRIQSQDLHQAQVLVDERNWAAKNIYELFGFLPEKKWQLFLA